MEHFLNILVQEHDGTLFLNILVQEQDGTWWIIDLRTQDQRLQ